MPIVKNLVEELSVVHYSGAEGAGDGGASTDGFGRGSMLSIAWVKCPNVA